MLLSDEQCRGLREYVDAGGSLLATFETSLRSERNELRGDFGLADVFGIHKVGEVIGTTGNAFYARIEKPHETLQGFGETNWPPGAEYRVPIAPVDGSPLTVVPGFVAYPPELSYPPQSRTDEPAMVVREKGKSCLVYFSRDIGRTMWRSGHTDLARLLQNSIRWILRGQAPVSIQGQGVIEAFAWETEPGFAIHVLNYTNPNMHRGWIREFYPIGAQKVRMTLPAGRRVTRIELLRREASIPFKADGGLVEFTRRFSTFSLLTSGVLMQSGGPNSTESENPMGSYRLEVNGHMYSGVAHLLDGTDNHDSVLAYQVINPTLESVTEAKITTSAFDAEFANAGAMVVSSQTKSGTNQLHGSAFEFLRNDHLQARDPFAQSGPIYGANDRTIPVTIWNQFGASLGGPIKKNQLFYFGDYQGTRRRTGGSKLVWVPTAAERGGDLNDLGINIYDPSGLAAPASRAQFPGNVIPASLLSPQAQRLINLLPLPNKPAAPNQPNYQGAGSIALQEDSFNTRIDHYTTTKLHVFGRFSLQAVRYDFPGHFRPGRRHGVRRQ